MKDHDPKPIDPCNDADYDAIEAGWDALRGANGEETERNANVQEAS